MGRLFDASNILYDAGRIVKSFFSFLQGLVNKIDPDVLMLVCFKYNIGRFMVCLFGKGNASGIDHGDSMFLLKSGHMGMAKKGVVAAQLPGLSHQAVCTRAHIKQMAMGHKELMPAK